MGRFLVKNDINRIVDMFNNTVRSVKNFDSLEDTDNNDINLVSSKLRDFYNKDNFGNDYFYRLLFYMFDFRKADYGDLAKRLAIIIMTIDPTFLAYKIYEENCKLDEISKEMRKNLGFYNKSFIDIEKEYIERFYNINDYSFIYKQKN